VTRAEARGASPDAPAPRRDGRGFWRAFGDPSLDAVVEAALGANLQVRGAWARVAQARAIGGQARSALWPQINLQADVSRRRSVLVLPNFTDPAGAAIVRAVESDTFALSAPVSFEVDAFARTIAQGRAADRDELALRDDVDAVAVTIAASAAEAWLSVVHQRALRRLLAEQLETSDSYRELVELRFREGLGAALDVFNQRAQVEGVRAQLAATIAQEEVAERQLAALLGRADARGLVPPDRVALPAAPDLPPPGIPAELLDRRPDLRAARRRVEAADERVAAAFADRFPRLVLTASAGWSSNEIETLFDRFVYSLGGSLQFPLWDGDRRRLLVAQNRALVWERTEQLAQAWVTALHEVGGALVQERQQREQIAALRARASAARSALDEARQRFAAGLLPDYLNVLSALNAAQQSDQAVLAAERQLLSFQIQLSRALGGDLPVLPQPSERQPAPAEPEE
jgi:NodT family efflux transporter outer membrane factor (OMF) lipoprotein